jgi:hypothetical protein
MSDTPEFADEINYLRTTPVEEILANHIFVMLQLVTLYVAATPPNLASAQLLIDTLGAMLHAGEGRLGEHESLYRAALTEAQQAYVRAASSAN